jgi:MFS family permease
MSSNGKAGPFSPFRHQAFVLLWGATLISNIGTWMHEVGAGWLMTTLNPDPAIVSLVQAATTLPVFLFALFAGALADRLDKRRMLITINLLLAAVIGILALLVSQQAMTPLLLVLFTLAVGTGAAFMAPAWQAVVPQLVPRENLKPAIALNSMGLNVSRAIGPALAGLLIAAIGLAAPFVLNALSHIAIVVALIVWKPAADASNRYRGPILADMATGLRHVKNNPAMLATVIRAGAFFVFASAYWAMLPLIARAAPGGGAELYGLLMGLIGAGAVSGALLLPAIQKKLPSSDAVARMGAIGTALVLFMLSVSAVPALLMIAAFLGGFAWIAVLTSFHVSAQTALPDWVRARGLAVFLMVFFGSMAGGSLFWGQVASATSVSAALIVAGVALLVGLVATRRYTVGQAEDRDLTPVAAWPEAPPLSRGQDTGRPALVTVEYAIREADRARFLELIQDFSKQRLRDGATRWHVYQSVEDPRIWIESFELPSWEEHLEQHKRVTPPDVDAQHLVQELDERPDGPVVRHYVAP